MVSIAPKSAIAVEATFSSTGQSDVVWAKKVTFDMQFAGTATVDVERDLAGSTDFDLVEGGRYAETAAVSRSVTVDGAYAPHRLNCTAHTDNVTYKIAVIDPGP